MEIYISKQMRQERIEDAAGVFGGESIGGLKRNENDPDERRPPGAKKVWTGSWGISRQRGFVLTRPRSSELRE